MLFFAVNHLQNSLLFHFLLPKHFHRIQKNKQLLLTLHDNIGLRMYNSPFLKFHIFFHSLHYLLKQYQKLLALDEVKLEFDEEALRAIAKKAMKKDTGARALRAIIEEFMLDIMYEIPKDDNIGKVTINLRHIRKSRFFSCLFL